MTDTEKQPESDAVAVLKADAASAGAKAAAVAARIAEAAKVAPGEVALALILARLADPELAREALALADGPRALTVAAVADTVGAPPLAIELWAAAIAAGVTGRRITVTIAGDGGEAARLSFAPPSRGPLQ